MDRIRIRGGQPLTGEIFISGAKNAALPLMVASLLTEETLELSNVPHLADIAQLTKLLGELGVDVHMNGCEDQGGHTGRVLALTAATIEKFRAPYDIVRKMRASFLVLGPLLARFGEAVVSLPGGCAIGARPVDLHLKAIEAMGAQITLEEGYVHASAPRGLHGGRFEFPFVSVGATENALMAACLASGETILENAAREPEIIDLGECLMKMGAEIDGLGTSTLRINGQSKLFGAKHRVMPDRIETGTYAIASAITAGDIALKDTRPDLIAALTPVLEASGATVVTEDSSVRVSREAGQPAPVDVQTEPFPGFPTDLQAQLMAYLSTAAGVSRIKETIFENRFMHVPELMRMGAQINIDGQLAVITGSPHLTGAQVMATDLRASVSLVLAGLVAEGETIVNRVYHLDRGFEQLEAKLGHCGAEITRLKDI